jgi:ABC-type Fe3+ transport system substrate-binding protein
MNDVRYDSPRTGRCFYQLYDTVKSVEDIEVVDIPKEQNAIEIEPIGVTTFTSNPETAKKFVDYLRFGRG